MGEADRSKGVPSVQERTQEKQGWRVRKTGKMTWGNRTGGPKRKFPRSEGSWKREGAKTGTNPRNRGGRCQLLLSKRCQGGKNAAWDWGTFSERHLARKEKETFLRGWKIRGG